MQPAHFQHYADLEHLIHQLLKYTHLNNKNNLQSEDIINHLLIPDEYLQIADIKVKSIRISEDVEKKFNEFCDKFKQYSKTSMLNYALIEFMEKYKG